MGAKCGKVTCCGLWVQRSNRGCYSLFKQSSEVGSRKVRLPTINGWQVRGKRLTAYTLLEFLTMLMYASPHSPGSGCSCRRQQRSQQRVEAAQVIADVKSRRGCPAAACLVESETHIVLRNGTSVLVILESIRMPIYVQHASAGDGFAFRDSVVLQHALC